MASALAVCKALESVCEISPKIKWVNDIFYKNKKVCGILSEAQTNLETCLLYTSDAADEL